MDYTVCFIKQGEHVLLLNRAFSSWMGCWNGVGGKIEAGETPQDAARREVLEETGLLLSDLRFRGIETWYVDHQYVGGMYVYRAELAPEETYPTPVKTHEGILDWKPLDWIIHPKNKGLATDIPLIIKQVLEGEEIYEHRCFYKDDTLIEHQVLPLVEAPI